MITQTQKENLKKEIEELFKKNNSDSSLFDFEAELDQNVSIEENKSLMLEKIKHLFNFEPTKEELKSNELLEMEQTIKTFKENFKNRLLNKENLLKFRAIAIYGDTGSGKTALSYTLLKIFQEAKREIYFLKHPKPELLTPLNFKNLDSIERTENLKNAVLYIDEPQLYFNIYDKKSNIIIAKLCSLARQRDLILLLSSSDSRVFSKHNESYFDLWLIKDLDYYGLKNGSKAKNIIKKNSFIEPAGVQLYKNEFFADCRLMPELNGKHTFNMPSYFTEELSKPYKN